MDWNVIIGGIIAFASLLGAGLSIWNFVQSPSTKNAADLAAFKTEVVSKSATFEKTVREDIKLLDAQVDDVRGRTQGLELVVKQLPDKDALHRLELGVEKLNTKFEGMAASAEATERTARRVESFLLKQAGVDA